MVTLSSSFSSAVTVLPNVFVERYMPEANGEFVKVYIYLVMSVSADPASFSIERMADHLLCAEKDIVRALKYWAKAGLLSVEYDSHKQISSICLLPIPNPAASGVTAAAVSQPESLSAAEKTPQPVEEAPAPAEEPAAPERRTISPARIRELKQNEDIVQLLYIAEQYMGKTLTSTEMQKILYFYDELKLSAELIEYLIEYCVSRNHRSVRYMESIALAWVQNGIRTVDEARSASSSYQKDYFTILKALGISGRNPIESEITIMDTWLNAYGFSMEIIREACSRTVLKTGQPSFQYADRILKDWKEHSVHTLKDIESLDEDHRKKQSTRTAAAKKTPAARPAAPNRFNNFQQREYDFEEYEKLLLNQ